MSNPAISVIVPIYNVQEYLPKCLDSIVNQDFNNYEVVMINDGSTDNSRQIAQDYTAKYHNMRLIDQENQGLGGARNTGIEHAIGDYFLFVDSDDSIKIHTLSCLYQKAIQEQADMVIFDFLIVDPDGNALMTEKGYMGTGYNLQQCPQLLLVTPSVWNKLMHRDLFIKTEIRFPPRAWYEDLRTIFKLYIFSEKIAYINEAFYLYLKRPGSIMNTSKADRICEIMDATDDLINYYKEHHLYDKYKDELEFIVINHVYYLGSLHVAQVDKNSRLLPEFKKYMAQYPNFMNNKYIDLLGQKGKVTLNLLNKENYFKLSMLLKLKKFMNNLK